MKLTIVLAILIGTLVLSCSTAAPAPVEPTLNLVDSTVEAMVAQERAVDATIGAKEKESVADQLTETPTPTPIPSFKGTCPEIFPDAISIPYQQYFDGLWNLYFETRFENKTYSYVSPTGSESRNGPFATWLYEMAIGHASAYIPTKFDVYGAIRWQDYVKYSQVVCSSYQDETSKRPLIIALEELLYANNQSLRSDWSGHASKWDAFEYIETGANVIDAVSPLGLEHYTKYITGAGVVIVGGNEVPDGAMLQARESVVYMTSARPEFRKILQRNQVRISIFGPSGDSSVLPEYPDSNEPGGFAMGMSDVSMTANSGWMCYPGHADRGGDPIIHEMAHTINHIVFEESNEVYFYERIYDLALAAIEKGTFAPFEQNLPEGEQQDISHMVGEYWASTVEGYIMDREGFKDSHDTREWIEENDPDLYKLITMYFPTEPWPDGKFCPDA